MRGRTEGSKSGRKSAASRPVDIALAKRLDRAVRWRCRELGYGNSLEQVSSAIGRSEDTLRAWCAGENAFSFDDLRRLHVWFEIHGLPGLIQEINSDIVPLTGSQFRVEQIPLTYDLPEHDPARKSEFRIRGEMRHLRDDELIALAISLRSANRSIVDVLSDMGLLPYTHVLAMDLRSDAIRGEWFATDTPVKFHASAIHRDLRTFHIGDPRDSSFGLILHDQMHKILQDDKPVIHVIQAPGVTYRRLAIPKSGRFIMAIPFDIQAQQPIEFN